MSYAQHLLMSYFKGDENESEWPASFHKISWNVFVFLGQKVKREKYKWIICVLELSAMESWQVLSALEICSNYLQVSPWEMEPSSQHIRLLHMYVCLHDTLPNKAHIPIVLAMCNGNLLVYLCSQRLTTSTAYLNKAWIHFLFSLDT